MPYFSNDLWTTGFISLPLCFFQYTVDCDKVSSLPEISFGISGKMFTLTGDQYILKVCLAAFLISAIFIISEAPFDVITVPALRKESLSLGSLHAKFMYFFD